LGGYFDAPLEANALLNTWSLSVEEQFYLVFPPLLALGLLLLGRRLQPRIAAVILSGVIASMSFMSALANGLGVSFPGAATLIGFFSPVSRAWEFLFGVMIALVPNRMCPSGRIASVGVLAGGLAIVAGMFAISATTPFPGPATLVPVLGSGLVVLCGGSASGFVPRALSSRAAVAVGDRSYSLYLWHWPAISFAHSIWPASAIVPALAFLVSIVPANLSYRFVEQPFRSRRGFSGRSLLLSLLFVAVPLPLAGWISSLAAAGTFIPERLGIIGSSVSGSISSDEFFSSIETVSVPCESSTAPSSADYFGDSARCRQTAVGTPVSVALLGDSHAEAMFLGIAELHPGANVAYYQQVNGPVSDTVAMNALIDEVALSSSVKAVVLDSARVRQRPEHGSLPDVVGRLSAAGKKAYIADDVPEFAADPYWCKFRRFPWSSHQCSKPSIWNDEKLAYTNQLLADVKHH
jgi:hypothetical protein